MTLKPFNLSKKSSKCHKFNAKQTYKCHRWAIQSSIHEPANPDPGIQEAVGAGQAQDPRMSIVKSSSKRWNKIMKT